MRYIFRKALNQITGLDVAFSLNLSFSIEDSLYSLSVLQQTLLVDYYQERVSEGWPT